MDKTEKVERFVAANKCFFFDPYSWQKRAVEMVRSKNTTLIVSSNKIGKSCVGANIVISWALGYEPWNPTDPGDGVEVPTKGGTAWYKASSLGIKPPVDIIIAGEDWKLHLGRTIVPELKEWAPQGHYTTKKNEQGVEYYWTWKNGSTFTLMCYSQDDDLFESFRAQGAWEDEPPPKSKHIGLSRGLLLDNGKTLMTLTPLKEAWILDEIVLSGRRDVGIVDGLKITDNPDLLRSDIKVLEGLGMDKGAITRFLRTLLYDDWEQKKPVTDRGAAAERLLDGYPDEEVSKLKILKFIKDIEPEDVPPRVFGEFKSLVGRVLKDFDYNMHVIKPFDVPANWPVTVMIDFHLSTPQAISYWAVDERDMHYCVGETWEHYSADQIADDIIKKIRTKGWKIKEAFIDPLSKGDTQYILNRLGSDQRDTFSILYDRLLEHGITLMVGSKDKESGVKNMQTWLRGPNNMPTVFIFEDCARHIYEVQRWVWDDHGKPSKDASDHFMENWYRYTLAGVRFKNHIIKPLRRPMGTPGSWMCG